MAEPTRLRRRLGAELRGARTLADITQRDLAKHLGVSQATVVRIERGEGALLPRAAVESLLDYCQASEETRERVLTLTEAAHSETWSWSASFDIGNPGHLQFVAAVGEAEAELVQDYSMQWVPGLLQTAEYARRLLPQVDTTGRMDIAAAVAARLERQQRLYEPGREFHFLLEEGALRWSPGPGVMPGQLDRVLSVATLDNVEIGVLPADRVGASGWHPFILSRLVDGALRVTTELRHGGQHLSDPDEVDLYVTLWKQLWEAALRGDAALDAIRARR